MTDRYFFLASLIIILLSCNSTLAASQSNSEFLEGETFARELSANSSEIENLKSINQINTPANSINIDSIDVSNANPNDAVTVSNGVLVFQALNSGGGQNILANTSSFASDSVSTIKIADLQITIDKISDEAITGDQIIDGSINSNHIANGAITTEKLSGPEVILNQTLTGFNPIAGSINSNTSLLSALGIISQSNSNSSNQISNKITNANPASTGDATFSNTITINGNVNITGTLNGYTPPNAPGGTPTLVSNISGPGSANSILYQAAANQTEKVNGTSFAVNKVLGMESPANPAPSWKRLKLERIRSTSINDNCNNVCNNISGLCVFAKRSGRDISCSAIGSPFNPSNPNNSGAVDCECYATSVVL